MVPQNILPKDNFLTYAQGTQPHKFLSPAHRQTGMY